MKSKRLFIEDFDDCLIEATTSLNYKRYLGSFNRFGYGGEDVDLLDLIRKVHSAGIYGRDLVIEVGRLANFNLDDERMDEIYSYSREIYLFEIPKLTRTTELAVVTKEIFNRCPNIMFAIATDNYTTLFVHHVLNFHALAHLFAVVVNADKDERYIPRKPNPKMLDVVMKGLQTEPNESLYIGDCEKDEKTAKNANIDYMHWRKFCRNYKSFLI